MLCVPLSKPASRRFELIEQRIPFETDSRVIYTPRERATKASLKELLDRDPFLIDMEITQDRTLIDYIPPEKRLISYHNFKKTPDLEKLHEQLQTIPAKHYKIATYANSTLDALRMLLMIKKHKIIGVAMGARGQFARILAKTLGSPIIYAALDEEHKNAPGQLTVDEVNWSQIKEGMGLYGLIGNPVHQSIGDCVHTQVMQEMGLNAIYVKMLVKAGELDAFFPLAHEVGFRGLSVTIPHKERVLPGQVVNTLKLEGGQLIGSNTDGEGALTAIHHHLVPKKPIVLGSGGAGKVVAEALGAILLSRSLGNLHEVATLEYDLLINATAVEDPIPEIPLRKEAYVMDLHPTPVETAILKRAEKKIYGYEMFIEQAALQLATWFGGDADSYRTQLKNRVVKTLNI